MLVLLGCLLTGFTMSVAGVALFAVALFICLLTHEMGHAVVGRWLGGGHPLVYLAWQGGDCCNETARLTRVQGVLMTAAGPLASLLPALLVVPVAAMAQGSLTEGVNVVGNFVLGQVPQVLLEESPPMMVIFGLYLVQICVWWSLFNLLPVFPLDGGQIMHGLMRSPQNMHRISLTFACILVFFFLALGAWWMVLIMGAFAVFNYRCMRDLVD